MCSTLSVVVVLYHTRTSVHLEYDWHDLNLNGSMEIQVSISACGIYLSLMYTYKTHINDFNFFFIVTAGFFIVTAGAATAVKISTPTNLTDMLHHYSKFKYRSNMPPVPEEPHPVRARSRSSRYCKNL